ncbi:MAG: single-stranded DNA-binding protein [Treponema sp.]|nr:single-stranded DNA-binding protein [Treponema sp.]
MNGMNQVILEGNVVRAPEFKDTGIGSKLCIMPIAVNRDYKDHNGNDTSEVGYYDVEAWGDKLASVIEKCGFKGRGVRVVGRLKQNRWQNDEGKWNSRIYVVAEHIDFKWMKKKDDESSDSTSESDLKSAAKGMRRAAEKEETVF